MIRTKKNGTSLFKALLLEHRLPSRYIRLGGFWNTVVLRKIRKIYLFLPILLNKYANEDITVVIPVRNRCDYRLVNALKSLREQDYDKKLIKISVIDYGSKKEFIDKYKEICKKFDAEYIRVENTIIWCKAHALNIGIKRAKTKYILSSDVDVIFRYNYIKECLKELKKNNYQVILSRCFDLPKNSLEYAKKLDFKKMFNSAKLRAEDVINTPGINMALSLFYKKINGYDENYGGWGEEDRDLIKRFKMVGLEINDISKKTYYFHQWHPRYEGLDLKYIKKKKAENYKYYKKNNSAIRNKNGWGKDEEKEIKDAFWNSVRRLEKTKKIWRKKFMRSVDYFFFKNFNKILLRLEVLPKYNKEDIMVVIPVRNRCDYRLVNALKSLREQDYDKKLIKISVIDYGSKKEFIDKYKEICKKFDAEYIRVENTIIWCKAHALNIGIKRANTKYVMSTDVDMILENNYLNEAVKELRRNPYQILISTFFCSSEGDINNKINIKKSYAELKDKANKIDTKTIFGNLNVGINVGLAYFYKKIKGYDERYKLWGYEDNDLIKRFELLGLNVCDISKKSSFIHQWHPSTEKKKDFIFEKHRYTNWNYLLKSSSIIRNKSGWGING